jgi:hypothetical protein
MNYSGKNKEVRMFWLTFFPPCAHAVLRTAHGMCCYPPNLIFSSRLFTVFLFKNHRFFNRCFNLQVFFGGLIFLYILRLGAWGHQFKTPCAVGSFLFKSSFEIFQFPTFERHSAWAPSLHPCAVHFILRVPSCHSRLKIKGFLNEQ